MVKSKMESLKVLIWFDRSETVSQDRKVVQCPFQPLQSFEHVLSVLSIPHF